LAIGLLSIPLTGVYLYYQIKPSMIELYNGISKWEENEKRRLDEKEDKPKE